MPGRPAARRAGIAQEAVSYASGGWGPGRSARGRKLGLTSGRGQRPGWKEDGPMGDATGRGMGFAESLGRWGESATIHWPVQRRKDYLPLFMRNLSSSYLRLSISEAIDILSILYIQEVWTIGKAEQLAALAAIESCKKQIPQAGNNRILTESFAVNLGRSPAAGNDNTRNFVAVRCEIISYSL